MGSLLMSLLKRGRTILRNKTWVFIKAVSKKKPLFYKKNSGKIEKIGF